MYIWRGTINQTFFCSYETIMYIFLYSTIFSYFKSVITDITILTLKYQSIWILDTALVNFDKSYEFLLDSFAQYVNNPQHTNTSSITLKGKKSKIQNSPKGSKINISSCLDKQVGVQNGEAEPQVWMWEKFKPN